MIIDSHAHINFNRFDKDRDLIIKKSLLCGVGMINVGTDFKSSKDVIEIAKKYENVWATIGLHPTDWEEGFEYDKYKKLYSENVVAVGEIGLDYYRDKKEKEQKEVFNKQLDLAEELNLPIIIHSREAFNDVYEILNNRKLKGVIHSFTGDVKVMNKFLDLGYYIGLNGIIFKADMEGVIKECPKERILIETDCPFLVPPGRGNRNEPLFVQDVLNKIEEIRGEKMGDVTYQNTKEIFKLI